MYGISSKIKKIITADNIWVLSDVSMVSFIDKSISDKKNILLSIQAIKIPTVDLLQTVL